MATKKTVTKKTATRKVSSKKVTSRKPAAVAQTSVTDTILGSASEIWLAGLGAFAKAQQEGVKIFSKLVSEGKEFEETFRKAPEKAVQEVTTKVGEVKSKVGEVRKKAFESVEKLESLFESRVEKALKSLGVPVNLDIDLLLKRIEELALEVAKLSEQLEQKPPAESSPEQAEAKKGTRATKKAATTASKAAKKTTGSARKTTKKTTVKAATETQQSADEAMKSVSRAAQAGKKTTSRKNAAKK